MLRIRKTIKPHCPSLERAEYVRILALASSWLRLRTGSVGSSMFRFQGILDP
jgi:hypothetical protein